LFGGLPIAGGRSLILDVAPNRQGFRISLGVDEVAERLGYASASTFSTAFSRRVGKPPGRYARAG